MSLATRTASIALFKLWQWDYCTEKSTIVDKRQVDKRREGVEREGGRGATNKQNCDCNILNEPRASFLNKKRVIYITY